MRKRRSTLGPSLRLIPVLILPLLLASSPAAADVTYVYDDLGRLVRVIDDGSAEYARYDYDAVGNLLRIGRGTMLPTVSSVSRSTLNLGSPWTLVLTGASLLGASVTASPGLTIPSVQVADDTITVRVVVDPDAPLGPASLTIRTEWGMTTVSLTLVPPPVRIITTVAGGRAPLNNPQGLTVDSHGNLFVANTFAEHVQNRSTSGLITIVAGGLGGGFDGDGGPATAAQLGEPTGVATDSQGNLFIADRDNNRIRKVSPDGTITTVAGTGDYGAGGDGGPATAAQLNFPTDVAVDSQGTLYIADQANQRVRAVSVDGTITTVAGTGDYGVGGDGGPAVAAQLGGPTGVAVDGQGTLYIADLESGRIRKVTP